MYLVREKSSKNILHINPAPLSQELIEKEVYFEFDPNTMEIGKIEGELPEAFDINDAGEIIELSLSQQVNVGMLDIHPSKKVVDNTVIDKTTLELFEQGLITLELYKQQKIAAFSSLAHMLRNALLPDYKIQNALLGIYDEKKTQVYKKTIEDFRNEFFRLKKAIEKTNTIEAITAIKEKFPTALSGAGQSQTKNTETNKKDDSTKSEKEKDKKTKVKTKTKKK